MASVHSINQEDYRDLEQYTTIRWGGLKFLSGLLNVLILMAAVVFVMNFILNKTDQWLSEGERFSIAVFGGGALLMATPLYFITGKRGDWIRSYFARNVHGYVARFWVHETETAQNWYCDVYTSFSDPGDTSGVFVQLGELKIEIQLGGWISFRRPGILKNGQLITHASPLRHWSVRLHKIYFHTGVVFVEVSYIHQSDYGKCEKIVLEVSEAIRLLNLVQQFNLGIVGISGALRYFMRNKDELAEEAERAREDLRRSVGRETMFVDQLEALARRIDETNRFKSTIEGLEIYLDVLVALRLAHHGVDPAKYDQVGDALEQARHDLDRLRSRRSRRSRDIPAVAR